MDVAAPCNACGSDVVLVLRLGQSPVVNLLADSSTEARRAPLFPKTLGCCENCGLAQLMEPIDSAVFYTEYSTPTEWKREPHLDRLVATIRPQLSRDARILDVGCNDGRFLRLLSHYGYQSVMGIEPTVNTAETASASGLKVLNLGLNSEVAEQLVAEHGSYDCVSLRQVLEHIVELDDFGLALNRLLVPGGMLIVEVPESSLHFEQGDYALWEEHVNYFTLATLASFLGHHGFQVHSSYVSTFSGRCLTVIASKSADTYGRGVSRPYERQTTADAELQGFRRWSTRFAALRSAVADELQESARHGSVALYGVGCRSSSFVNAMDIGHLISFAIDDQTEKQGKFMPGSGIEILTSSQALSRMKSDSLVLLGVNGENEASLIADSPVLTDHRFASVLPPSEYLMRAWDSYSDGA